jgi:hypothetical protein
MNPTMNPTMMNPTMNPTMMNPTTMRPQMGGGDNNQKYKIKYLKYKQKYMQLKNM